jgi:hypothetical protein
MRGSTTTHAENETRRTVTPTPADVREQAAEHGVPTSTDGGPGSGGWSTRAALGGLAAAVTCLLVWTKRRARHRDG